MPDTSEQHGHARFAVSGDALGHHGQVRIGTWNLEGRWSPDHRRLLTEQECDVWLLTEVRTDVVLAGFESHLSRSTMVEQSHWAGVFSGSPLQPMPDPHLASAAASSFGWCFCSSILPWRSCGSTPWGEGTNGEKTERAVNQLMGSLPLDGLVWGGDWNHSMHGREYVGSLAGRITIREAVAARRLKLATENAPHRLPGLGSIDHIAVPHQADVITTNRVVAETRSGQRLSDHDAYVTEVTSSSTLRMPVISTPR